MTLGDLIQAAKKKLSMREKSTDSVDYDQYDDVDDETRGNLGRDIDEAEEANQDYGKPNTWLYYIIQAGNKKTKDQILAENATESQSASSSTVTSPTSITSPSTFH